MRWAIVDEDGFCVQSGSSANAPTGAIELPANVAPAAAQHMRIVDGEWVMKPAVVAEPVELANETAIRRDIDYRRAVDDERARRLVVGTDVNIPGYGWIALQGREVDINRMTSLGVLAIGKVTVDDISTMEFIARDNVVHTLLPAQVLQMTALGGQYVSALHIAARTIKDMDPRPADPTDNSLWPQPSVAGSGPTVPL